MATALQIDPDAPERSEDASLPGKRGPWLHWMMTECKARRARAPARPVSLVGWPRQHVLTARRAGPTRGQRRTPSRAATTCPRSLRLVRVEYVWPCLQSQQRVLRRSDACHRGGQQATTAIFLSSSRGRSHRRRATRVRHQSAHSMTLLSVRPLFPLERADARAPGLSACARVVNRVPARPVLRDLVRPSGVH